MMLEKGSFGKRYWIALALFALFFVAGSAIAEPIDDSAPGSFLPEPFWLSDGDDAAASVCSGQKAGYSCDKVESCDCGDTLCCTGSSCELANGQEGCDDKNPCCSGNCVTEDGKSTCRPKSNDQVSVSI